MQIRQSDPAHITLDLSHNELILLNNALNEICHGMDRAQFSMRLGATWEELESLRRQIQTALESMTKPKDEG